jgi:hypothetical protein
MTQPDHHVMGKLMGDIQHRAEILDRASSPLWEAMDESQPIDRRAMIKPIKDNIVFLRTLLGRLETFVEEVESIKVQEAKS